MSGSTLDVELYSEGRRLFQNVEEFFLVDSILTRSTSNFIGTPVHGTATLQASTQR